MMLPGIPDIPYTRAELRQLCKTLTTLAPVFHLGDHRLVIHLVSVNDFPAHTTNFEHEHTFYEALIALAGNGQVLKDLQQVIVPGCVLAFGPHERHAWQILDEPHRSFVIWFDITPPIPFVRPPHWPVWPGILREIAQLLQEISEGEVGWNHRALARLTIILSRILTMAKWSPSDAVIASHDPGRLAQVIDQFLRDNLTQKVMLSDIAVHLASSVRRLTRDYRRATGKSIMERLLELRMEHAAELLAETDLTLSAIADQVGIPDPSYFCHCFRSTYGMSPGNYRKQVSGDSDK